jgi:hypothetical protein
MCDEIRDSDEYEPAHGLSSAESASRNDLLGFSDEELLRSAAVAAQINVKAIKVDVDDNFKALVVGEKHTKERLDWNPLKNNGDAFTLAIKTGVRFSFHPVLGQAIVIAFRGEELLVNVEDCSGDQYSASRKAIVLAAAQIGRART